MPNYRRLTEFKARVLDYIEDFYKQNKYPPSLREVGEHVGSDSTSSIKYAMEMLAEDGYLTKGVEGQARTMVPTYKERVAINESTEEPN